MDLPALDVLKEKNIYSGSQGEFRYKIQPEGEGMKAWAYQTYCLEYCQQNGLVLDEAEFSLDTSGMEQLTVWLEKQAIKIGTDNEHKKI